MVRVLIDKSHQSILNETRVHFDRTFVSEKLNHCSVQLLTALITTEIRLLRSVIFRKPGKTLETIETMNRLLP